MSSAVNQSKVLCSQDDALEVLKEVIDKCFIVRNGDLIPDPGASLMEVNPFLYAKVTLLIHS